VRYNTLSTAVKALRCKLFGISDVNRWVDVADYDDWVERTRLIAGLVPAGSRVIEFGAGHRRLQGLLSADCSYTPSDLASRGPDTIVFDLNARPLPDLRDQRFDVAVLAGVLEYVANLPSFTAWLAQQAPLCICSYGCVATPRHSPGRLKEHIDRARAGWANTLDERQLIDIFSAAGFVKRHTTDWHTPEGSERIFLFSRKDVAQA